ncbi:hypothetical protein CO666_23145 [Rhizobium chutanense]|uniref:Uncharacterized protein n=1 Tax=Rhizobium chutanense TaxID=2035448 RepID=A0A2A6J6M6_9HYPH|nr:hypothetical protein CO666_23145 [Rhizobium chutanense]
MNAALSCTNRIVGDGGTVTACEILIFGRRSGPQVSPSPLWGGVGEGSFFRLISPNRLGLVDLTPRD